MRQSVAVWLILRDLAVLHKPECAGVLPGIILQQRAETEIIDRKSVPQANPYFHQPTCNEKIEKGESIEVAIKRGAREDLGEKFANDFCFSKLISFGAENFRYKDEDFTGFNFVGSISKEQLMLIRLHAGAMPNFTSVGRGLLSQISNKSSGIDPKDNVVLFDDQFKALHKLFCLREMLLHLA